MPSLLTATQLKTTRCGLVRPFGGRLLLRDVPVTGERCRRLLGMLRPKISGDSAYQEVRRGSLGESSRCSGDASKS